MMIKGEHHNLSVRKPFPLPRGNDADTSGLCYIMPLFFISVSLEARMHAVITRWERTQIHYCGITLMWRTHSIGLRCVQCIMLIVFVRLMFSITSLPIFSTISYHRCWHVRFKFGFTDWYIFMQVNDFQSSALKNESIKPYISHNTTNTHQV